ncbi:MAG TPA: GAF domain-containing protein [Methylomirabilota bacterium]|nr:GAF domain-containing protein [Methylomirabilota bacterium]
MTSAPITPPVEATLRILMNSVPFLMGAAVVRQPPGSDGLVASVGRMPWLHDRRLTTLQLPDDTLPSNRAVALDWPVPFQAEWVGAPPRLLISRLVFHGRTVGVLLGTLVSREPLSQQTREALDLSGELIASAVAGESAYATSVPPPASEDERAAPPSIFAPAPARPTPSDLVVEEVRKGLESAVDARSLGRVLRDAMSQITDASAFSVALFHLSRAEVAYRYKVVGPDRDSAELGRQHVDDGPACYAARHERRWHVFAREVAIRDEADVRVREVIVLQIPLATSGEVYGIVTVQTFRPEGYTDQELRLIATIVEASSTHFALARAAGRFQPAAAPAPAAPSTPSDLRAHTAGAVPITVAPVSAAAPAVATAPVTAVSSALSAPPEPLITTPTPMNTASGSDIPAAPTARAGRNAEDVLRDLLRRCAGAGFTTAFLLGVHSGAGSLKGEMVSEGEAARELDYALGISSGKFAIPLDDRYNAIARAVREGRIVPAPTLYEITRPLTDFEGAQTIERLAKGGRSVTLPLVVSGTPAGALVLGPMAEDPTFFAIEAVRGYVADAAKELQTLWT